MPDNANSLAVDGRMQAEMVNGDAEVIGINVRQGDIAGSPLLSPVQDPSKASVTKPRPAMVCAYRPDDRSLTAPNGPPTASADSRRLTRFFGRYRSPAKVMP